MTDRPNEIGAGASAQREYQRRSEARQRRFKRALGPRLGGLALALTDEPQSTRAWAQGARGEREVARALAGIPGLRLLNDLHVPGRPSNIDHVAVASAGVFVIDAKDHRGEIHIRDLGGFFRTDERLFVGRHDRSHLADNMAWQVDVVQHVLDSCAIAPVVKVVPVLCFVNGDWPWFRAPSEFRGVRLEGTNSIKKLFARPPLLDPGMVDAISQALASSLGPA
jgi:hypothetical protein